MSLHQEIEHLKVVFTGVNEYSIKIVNRTVNKELHRKQRLQNTVINNGGMEKVKIMLPYNGKQSNKRLSKMKKQLTNRHPLKLKEQLYIKLKTGN